MAELVVHPERPQARHRHGADPRRAGSEAAAAPGSGRTATCRAARATADALGLVRCASCCRCGGRCADLPDADGRRRRADPHLRRARPTTPNCCGSTTPRSRGIPSRAAGPRPTSPSAARSRGSTPPACSWRVDERDRRAARLPLDEGARRARRRVRRGVRRRRRPGGAGPRAGRAADRWSACSTWPSDCRAAAPQTPGDALRRGRQHRGGEDLSSGSGSSVHSVDAAYAAVDLMSQRGTRPVITEPVHPPFTFHPRIRPPRPHTLPGEAPRSRIDRHEKVGSVKLNRIGKASRSRRSRRRRSPR